MILKALKMNKKGTAPKTVTITMTIDEAGSIAKVFGEFSPLKFGEKFPHIDPSISGEIYDCLTGDVFNRFWDDGVNGWMRGEEPGGF